MRKSDVVFFLSGAAALVHESVWARLLARLLGSDASAAAIVLAVFMGGMGLGAWSFGARAQRSATPVRDFALLECAIGIWAAASPWLLASLHPVAGTTARALVAVLVLLPPTLSMGATFPLMGRIAIRSAEQSERELSSFYGANTLGAACGALLAAFVCMPRLGLQGALRAGALIEFAAAALALAWLRTPASAAAERVAGPAPEAHGARTPWREPLLIVALLMGASSLALEIVAMRLLVTVTGASVYALAIVLAVFLAGIGLGSRQLAQRQRERERKLPARATGSARDDVFFAALLAPVLMIAGLLALRWQLGEHDLFASLRNRVPQGAGLLRLWLSHVLFAVLALLPPAIAFGRALPAIGAALIAAHPRAARERLLGALYAANTLGALGGSLAAAFVLLPRLGPRGALAVVLALPLLAAAVCARGRRVAWAVGVLATGGAATLLLSPRALDDGRRVLLLAHDAHATIAVEETRAADGSVVRSLRVQGKPEASTAPVDVRLQLLLGHVPGLVHGDVHEALVIGMGTGMTAGSLLDLPTLAHLTIFEISPAIERATRAFAAFNRGLLDDPRTRLVIADGRHALATSSAHYDLITSDPVHPWTRGSSDLYTLEHFRSMAAHLKPGGIASQWLPLYELSESDVRTVIATWTSAFEHTSAWLSAYDLVLLGSRAALPREVLLCELELPASMLRSLTAVGIHGGVDIAALQVAYDDDLRSFAAGGRPMRDDRPVLEFDAPLSYLSGYSVDVLRWAGRDEFVERLPAACRARARELRVLLARFLERLPNGWGSAAGAYGKELLALPALSAR